MSSLDSNPGFFDLVGNVRTMRRLKPDPVPDEILRKVLEAGVQAPSGMNSQPWAFLVVRDPQHKKWFADRYKAGVESRFGPLEIPEADRSEIARMGRALRYQCDHMHEFPVLLLVAGRRDWPLKVPESERVGKAPPNYGAVYPCVQNILLACRAVGLGAALTTMHQVFEDELHEHFAIPDEFGVVVTIPIGYPIGKFGPARRTPAANVTYFDVWGEKGEAARRATQPAGWRGRSEAATVAPMRHSIALPRISSVRCGPNCPERNPESGAPNIPAAPMKPIE